MSRIDLFTTDYSEGTRIAWEMGFAPMLQLNPVGAPAALGAAAFALWRPFPGVVYLHGDRATGKTTLLDQLRDLIDPQRVPERVASFEGSTIRGLFSSGALFVDDVPLASGASGRRAQDRVAELVRAVYNGAARIGDGGSIVPPPIMFLAGELVLSGATAARALVIEMGPVTRTVVAASSKALNREARQEFARRFAAWLEKQDDDALGDEFEDFAPELDTRQLVAARFGVELLNRFLSENSDIRVELDLHTLARSRRGREPQLEVAALAEAVVEAVASGTHRLVGGPDSAARVLGRIDDRTVSLIPTAAVSLLTDWHITPTALAVALDDAGLLNRPGGTEARTTPQRIDGKVTRVWELDGLFDDEQLAVLRGHQ